MMNFPAPQRLDRVVICAVMAGEYYGQTGIITHWNSRTTCLVVPDSNPKVEALIPLEFLVHERYRAELDLPTLKAARAAASVETEPASAPVETTTREMPVKGDSVPGKRGKPRTKAYVTAETGKAALAEYNAGKGVVELAAKYNFVQEELKEYFISQGVVLRGRGRAKL